MKERIKHLGLFEGIGGFSIAAREAGWQTVAWCEWNEFGQKVLRYHFPNAEGYGDITKTNFTKHANKIDIITGGFPCQPYSQAGKRKGKEDERHLWPEMLRAIREVQPRYVVGENVRGLTTWNGGLVFDEVQADLEAQGFEVLPFLLPACAVNAPHKRDRIWFIAYSRSNGLKLRGFRENRSTAAEGFSVKEKRERIRDDNRRVSEQRLASNPESGRQGGISNATETTGTQESDKLSGGICRVQYASNANGERLRGKGDGIRESGQSCENSERYNWENFPTQSPICNRNDGLSLGLANITISGKKGPRTLNAEQTYGRWRNESLKALGNAIVPQVAFEIFKVINACELRSTL